ncbi:tyrosine-protein phosphatase [Metabacillus idriensis]|uniref:tyrosine-protein phosphatase n=1 Tax=Metabacillus idriensis TaxID=324768 RepID=UPI003D27E3FD
MHPKFDGLYNFRDIGGLVTKDGRKIKTGVIFRSDELSKLSKQDLDKMSQLNIKMVCDLRTLREQKSKPSKITVEHGVNVIKVSFQDQSQEFTHLQFFKFLAGQSGRIDFLEVMENLYGQMAFDSGKQLRKIMEELSNESKLPALIHCTGGKDRTGFISAFIQLLAGASIEDVTHHYLISNELIGPRMKKIERFIRYFSLFRVSAEQLKPVLEVRREYLLKVYEEILKKHETFENYAEEVCGINQDQIEKLKQNLLV